jgi:hypothetical protein
VRSRLYGKGEAHVNLNFPYSTYDAELLKLTTDALDAACGNRPYLNGIDGRGQRPAMAFQIMLAVAAGERNPKRLKLAALNASAGHNLDC